MVDTRVDHHFEIVHCVWLAERLYNWTEVTRSGLSAPETDLYMCGIPSICAAPVERADLPQDNMLDDGDT